jgi:hypothetical protein
MAESVRALFSEHQVLAAADLTQVVDHDRNVDARHGRYLHTPGIAFGLELIEKDVSVPQLTGPPKPAKDVTLTTGVFVDGHGQHVVVDADRRLSTALIDSITPQRDDSQPIGWSYPHPLFIVAEEVTAPPVDSLSACETSIVTRVVEGYELVLGAQGDHLRMGDQRPAAPGDDLSVSLPPWRVLLGFVRVDINIGRFVQVTPAHDGVGRQYAGVRASSVAGHGGQIELHPAADDSAGLGKLLVGEDELVYGPVQGAGDVDPVFRVSLAGDLMVRGSFKSLLGEGVHCVSGVASHGITLPLPVGITNDKVTDGSIAVHIAVSPVLPPLDPANVAPPPVVYECSVNAQRRLTCVIDPAGGGQLNGSANYLVLTTPSG